MLSLDSGAGVAITAGRYASGWAATLVSAVTAACEADDDPIDKLLSGLRRAVIANDPEKSVPILFVSSDCFESKHRCAQQLSER